MKIKMKRLDPRSKLPSYALPGDAAMDLFALEEMTIAPGEKAIVRTGISMEIPDGYAGFIWDKSSLGIKYGLRTLGGVIDSSYRGDVRVGIVNLSKEPYVIEAGHKVAQMAIQRVETPEIVEADEISETRRMHGTFGSTGI